MLPSKCKERRLLSVNRFISWSIHHSQYRPLARKLLTVVSEEGGIGDDLRDRLITNITDTLNAKELGTTENDKTDEDTQMQEPEEETLDDEETMDWSSTHTSTLGTPLASSTPHGDRAVDTLGHVQGGHKRTYSSPYESTRIIKKSKATHGTEEHGESQAEVLTNRIIQDLEQLQSLQSSASSTATRDCSPASRPRVLSTQPRESMPSGASEVSITFDQDESAAASARRASGTSGLGHSITPDTGPFVVGHPEPERLRMRVYHAGREEARTIRYRLADHMDWNNPTDVLAANKWRLQIYARYDGAQPRRPNVQFHSIQRAWVFQYLLAARLRKEKHIVPMPSLKAVTREFNREFFPVRLLACGGTLFRCEERGWESLGSEIDRNNDLRWAKGADPKVDNRVVKGGVWKHGKVWIAKEGGELVEVPGEVKHKGRKIVSLVDLHLGSLTWPTGPWPSAAAHTMRVAEMAGADVACEKFEAVAEDDGSEIEEEVL